MNYLKLAALSGVLFLGACGEAEEEQPKSNARQMAEVQDVMADAAQGAAQKQIDAYEAAKSGRDQMQICIEAMGVVETLRLMQEAEMLAEWEPIQEEECEPVGMTGSY